MQIIKPIVLLKIPVYLMGEEAKERVEHLAGVSENLIEAHGELAEKAIWLMGFLGVVSLVNFIGLIKKSSFVKLITTGTLIVSLVTVALFARVGYLGGQIRHSEIRTGNAQLQNELYRGNQGCD